jgi:hypothetical protein
VQRHDLLLATSWGDLQQSRDFAFAGQHQYDLDRAWT